MTSWPMTSGKYETRHPSADVLWIANTMRAEALRRSCMRDQRPGEYVLTVLYGYTTIKTNGRSGAFGRCAAIERQRSP